MATRQEIYDRIKKTSKQEYILEEMVRLGFWPANESIPTNPASDIKRQGELERELRKLTFENRKLQNVELIKREQRKKRLEESKRKRKENKERKLRERTERAENWNAKKTREISYLGKGFSKGLHSPQPELDRLSKYGLEQLTSPLALANAMGIHLGLLRFIAFGRKTSTVSHYHRFAIQKKSGGVRNISAPMPQLKTAQRWILDYILSPIQVHDAAHGFRAERSIVTNASPHVGAAVVVNLDLKDFFPTITFRRIKGIFRNIGFDESVATVLSMICSESEVSPVELDQQLYYVARGERHLPQGAPTSPAITNLICRGMDVRLDRIAKKLNFSYTRYADDITISSKNKDADVGRALRQVQHVITDENFVVHPDKTRILRAGRRLEVTGLTVNEKLSVSRQELRKFRAVLFQIEKDGPTGKSWGRAANVIASIFGYANFVAMVDPVKGLKFQQQVARIIEKHGSGDFDPARAKVARNQTPAERPPIKVNLNEHSDANVSVNQSAAMKGEDQEVPAAKTPQAPEQEKKPWWKLW